MKISLLSLNPVMKEGQNLERELQESRSQEAKKDIVFSATNTVIASKGDKITAKHLSKVQKIVKDRLEQLENEFKASFKKTSIN